MRKFLLSTTVILFALPVASSAEDLAYSISVQKDRFAILVEMEGDEASSLALSYTHPRQILSEKSSLEYVATIERDFELERTSLKGDVKYRYTLAPKTTMYAIANFDYHMADENTFIIGPTIGIAYSITDKLSVYGDLSTFFDVSNDFDNIGSELGGGVSYGLTEKVWLTGGFTRNFDTDWKEETSFYLNTTFVF